MAWQVQQLFEACARLSATKRPDLRRLWLNEFCGLIAACAQICGSSCSNSWKLAALKIQKYAPISTNLTGPYIHFYITLHWDVNVTMTSWLTLGRAFSGKRDAIANKDRHGVIVLARQTGCVEIKHVTKVNLGHELSKQLCTDCEHPHQTLNTPMYTELKAHRQILNREITQALWGPPVGLELALAPQKAERIRFLHTKCHHVRCSWLKFESLGREHRLSRRSTPSNPWTCCLQNHCTCASETQLKKKQSWTQVKYAKQWFCSTSGSRVSQNVCRQGTKYSIPTKHKLAASVKAYLGHMCVLNMTELP